MTWTWRVTKYILIVSGVIFWICVGPWVSHQRRWMTVRGHVEDAQSGERVANAKVIVTAWDYGIWDASPTNYGTLTNAQGEFRVWVHPGHWIARIDVATCTPVGKYDDIVGLPGSYAPLAANHRAYYQVGLEYSTFNGRWAGDVKWEK